MLDDAISVAVAQAGDAIVVSVKGEIDLESVPVLKTALDGLSSGQHVIVDCAGVSFMDSTGLNLIVSQMQRFDDSGGSLRLRHVSFPVRHVVEITGLIQLIGSYDD